MYVAPTVSPSALIAGSCMGCGSGATAISGLPGGGSGGTGGTYGGAGGVSGSTGAPGSAGATGAAGASSIEAGAKDLPEAKGALEQAAGTAGAILNAAVQPGSDWFWILLALAALAGATTRKRRRR